MTQSFYTVEIPQQRPAEVTEWPSKQEALDFHLNEWWSVCSGYPEPSTEAEIFDWVARDLHAFRAFESLEDLLQWAIGYTNHGGHQRHKVLTQVEALCKEVQS